MPRCLKAWVCERTQQAEVCGDLGKPWQTFYWSRWYERAAQLISVDIEITADQERDAIDKRRINHVALHDRYSEQAEATLFCGPSPSSTCLPAGILLGKSCHVIFRAPRPLFCAEAIVGTPIQRGTSEAGPGNLGSLTNMTLWQTAHSRFSHNSHVKNTQVCCAAGAMRANGVVVVKRCAT